jgi:ATPase family AAA domain-containing protein 3A/B
MLFLSFVYLLSNVANAQLDVLYQDISPANCTESLHKIKNAPIKLYQFKYDSVEGRRHMGVIGYDAEKYFPESIDVIPLYTIPSKDRNRSNIQIKNFPLIDRNVLFMHSFAAMKELISSYEEIDSSILRLLHQSNRQLEIFEDIEKRFLVENAEQQSVTEKLISLESQRIEKEKELENHRSHEEHLRNIAALEEEKKMFAYQEELVNVRLSREEDLQKKRLEDSINFERELATKRELLRRETEEKLLSQKISFERELEIQKSKFEGERIKAEIQAKAELERKNEDVTIRRLTLQADLDTKRFIDGFEVVWAQLAIFSRDLLARPSDVLLLLGLIFVAVISYHSIKEFSMTLRQYIQNQLGRPMLIRETSSSSFLSPWNWMKRLSWKNETDEKSSIRNMFRDVILSPEDTERVVQLTVATRNTKRLGTSYRHILLYGPPGTGKTLIARRLAESSGMDYAIMSGGDIGPLGEDAVNQLHSLFRWASRSRRGVLLFIDESEAFLGARDRNPNSENVHIRNALNALLYQTGTHSKTFMLVLATNRPEELDPAILDRIDVSLLIGLPSLPQRKELFQLYLQSIASKLEKSSRSLFVSNIRCSLDDECLSEQNMESMARKADGFSGREISKLAIAAEYAMLLSEDKKLTVKLLQHVLDTKRMEHLKKSQYINGQ